MLCQLWISRSWLIDIARDDDELVANAGFVRVVVADDLDAIDDRRGAFVDVPAQVDEMLRRVRRDAPLDDRP